MKHRFELISQIVEIERQLASTKFTNSGCIYFKGDIPEDMCFDGVLVPGVPLQSSELDRFRLGPLTSSGLWRGDRASMNMNRGPCKFAMRIVQLVFSDCIQITDRLNL